MRVSEQYYVSAPLDTGYGWCWRCIGEEDVGQVFEGGKDSEEEMEVQGYDPPPSERQGPPIYHVINVWAEGVCQNMSVDDNISGAAS